MTDEECLKIIRESPFPGVEPVIAERIVELLASAYQKRRAAGAEPADALLDLTEGLLVRGM